MYGVDAPKKKAKQKTQPDQTLVNMSSWRVFKGVKIARTAGASKVANVREYVNV